MVNFTKMHGLGNDYVYLDGRDMRVPNPGNLAIAMSDRHFGVGSDGIVLILPSSAADCRMRMFNADGSEAEMCGNAIRCVARYVHERWNLKANPLRVETRCGVKPVWLTLRQKKVAAATVDMGIPVLEPERIPVVADSNHVRIGAFAFTCVSMGNPHAVTFVPDVACAPVLEKGPELEYAAVFPRRCNIEFCEVLGPRTVRMRVWERGAGETLACGTGACATVVACVLNGLTGRKVDVKVPGGVLQIEWRKADGHVYMTGPAEFVFDGVWLKK